MNKVLNTFFEINSDVDFLRIDVLKQNFPSALSDWDKNSLACFISVRCGGFTGSFNADLMSVDFQIFKKELEILYDNLNRNATLETIEGQVTVHVEGDGVGHLKIKCWLMDYAGTGNELYCEFHMDQTGIQNLVSQLSNILSVYKVYGQFKDSKHSS